MKKYFYLAAVSAMMLTACSSDKDVLQPTPEPTQSVAVQQQAVAFDTYLSGTTASTRAGDPEGVMTTNKLKDTNKGFGVFAFYHNDNLYGSGTLAPNFMFNEHVYWTSGGGWTYSPLKYWPNETLQDSQTTDGAATSSTHIDRLSFFAYAPYVSTGTGETLDTENNSYMVATYSGTPLAPATYYDKAWKGGETSGILSMSAQDREGDPLVEWGYTYNLDKNVDLLWGVAPAGMAYQSVNPTNPLTSDPGYVNKTFGLPLTDMLKPDKDLKMKFLFQHALSRISLSVVSAIDQIAAGDDANKFTTDGNTKVLIKDVQVWGDFGTRGVLNLKNTVANTAKWIDTSILKSDDDNTDPLFWFDNGVAIKASATPATPYMTANGYIASALRYDATQIAAVNNASTFASVNKGVLPSEQILLEADGSGNPRYIMVIPTGSTKIKVKIKYAVVTFDEKLEAKLSNVENDITKTVTVDLKNGKSYNLKLILGLTSVKLDATVADWQVADDAEVNLPKNN